MRELTLHILDIIENSREAGADLIKLKIFEQPEQDSLKIFLKDNGSGIDEDKLEDITNPFVTTRTTREVGLGLSLFKQAAERCGGNFYIKSEKGKGTEVMVEFPYNHIDRAPLGDIITTIISFIAVNGDSIDLIYRHKFKNREFCFDSREVKKELDGISIQSKEIISWIKNYLKDSFAEIYGGEN
ncbi:MULTISPECIES: ATP-binding protein [unclassified Halanaerobium]|uniref:ATP-binding protein n=1 Tax=unclassified Halanaerobium TaxID=2641197 RepID=UPI000DF409D1|nr:MULTISPECIES: ATP-binding protein [unclassified Halanaerobium]RCW49260.1 histidine kinase/DNA gyrase B/HSP90-like ATPase [Halanaerobium sp. MA284_MarDTE_T2]RCW83999.1 histidine kinase/DNA gyrase B/HSP90-like ATPase [Halanaerobium sp. DL-01]